MPEVKSVEETQDYFRTYAAAVQICAPNGLRRGQAAAVHALTGHLSLKTEPAIAVLPTGAGKTDVAILLPYLLNARRVLVVVPSDSVRSQVAKRFETLSVLKGAGVFGADTPPPKVHKLSKRLASLDDWNKLQEYDVVVTTPHSISPLLKGVLQPPIELFDLLLIDEAHHSPAKTWQSVLDAFPHAKRALFTATPFRRDKKQIKGNIVTNYSLRDARKDGVFGDINYRPVTPAPGEDSDTAIASAVEEAFNEDREAGFDHSILVRADSISHAEALLEKYGSATKLKLEVVHSQHGIKKIEKTLESLRQRTLDGVICVNMLGEGFDQPSLKIAALHAPHASLGITLQFIGRFARVGNETLGAAQFFAVPAEIEGEMESLFHDDAVWQELIINLAEARVLLEDQIRTDLASFDPPEIQEPGMEEISLYALRPTFHVKVYRVPENVPINLAHEIDLPRPFEVMYRQYSEDLSTVVLIAREQQRPRWSDQLRFGRTEYELFVVHHDAAGRFLFICASRRADSIYRHIAKEYIGEAFKGLPLYMINRTLVGLHKIECFSVGMKNRLHTAKHESYRMLAGRNAHQAIRTTDGRLFHQGHIFCTAINEAQQKITLGYSSGSKLWSSGKGAIPQLIRWCGGMARKMESSGGVVTAPGLDILEVGVPIVALPRDVFAVDWDPLVYEDGIEAEIQDQQETVMLADLSLRIDRAASAADHIRVVLETDDDQWEFDFEANQAVFFTLVSGKDVQVLFSGDRLPIVDFLNEYPLYFYCTSFAKLHGDEYFPAAARTETFNLDLIQPIAWVAEGVNPLKEFWKGDEARNGKQSIHEYLERTLNIEDNKIVLYDHRSGEIADFFTIKVDARQVTVTLYHCKASGGDGAGNRVDDVYEVCGQVVKSFNLAMDEKLVLKHIRRRVSKGKVHSRFIRGSLAELESIFRQSAGKKMGYKFAIVQPGISKVDIGDESLSVLAAANEFVHSLGAEDLCVLASA